MMLKRLFCFSAGLLILGTAAASTPSWSDLAGKVVYNRAIYRLQAEDGRTFGIPALTALRVVEVEGSGASAQPWFEVEGLGRGRISDGDRARIDSRRADGRLPDDWFWVYLEDPHRTHPDWDRTFWSAIEERSIIHEMTPEMVRMAFGEPDKINVNRRPENVQEQWIYSTGSIWFVEGKVFSWQAP